MGSTFHISRLEEATWLTGGALIPTPTRAVGGEPRTEVRGAPASGPEAFSAASRDDLQPLGTPWVTHASAVADTLTR